MKSTLVLLTLCLVSSFSFSQDVLVREQAVLLLEKANAASTPLHLPNLERVDTFRVFGSDSGVKEGSFSRVVVQGIGRREETTFGDYHVVDVITDRGVTTVRTTEVAPPEVHTLKGLTPVAHVYLDHSDVVRSIANREMGGRPARCIELNTINGEKNDSNEVCVDAANGTLLTETLGQSLIENSEFFPFAGGLMPGKIRYTFAGSLKMEITQTMSVLSDSASNVLAAPPNAQVRSFCKTYRAPFGQSMPQPKPGNGGVDTDIVLRGMIYADGKLHQVVVQSSDRPDLNTEALNLIQTWVFTPSMCNGQPNAIEASFVMHFQGR